MASIAASGFGFEVGEGDGVFECCGLAVEPGFCLEEGEGLGEDGFACGAEHDGRMDGGFVVWLRGEELVRLRGLYSNCWRFVIVTVLSCSH